MPASKAKAAETAARRTKLIQLRLAGISFDDPRILALGYKSRQAASKDMIRALDKRHKEQDAAVSTYRQQENLRLDALLEAVWPHATNPVRMVVDRDDPDAEPEEKFDRSAVDVALRLLERRAKLNGLDMPIQAEVSGPGGGPLELAPVDVHALHALIGMAGEPDPDEDDDPYPDEQYVDDDQDDDGDGQDADGGA
jgi:hypothetical protein